MAPMSEDEHNVQHILYVTSDVALQAKHRADDAMVAGDYDTSIKELTTSIDELAIDAEAFCALRHAAAFLRNTRGAWHRVITAAEGRVPIEEVIKAEAEAEERLEKEKASIVVPEALPRSSKRGSTAVEPFFTELGLAAKGAGEAEFARRAYGRAHRHYSEALCEAKLDEMSHPVRRAHAMLLCNRALCSLLMRRFEAAREDAREAVKLDATWGRGWDRLIAACAGLGDAENLAEANGALAEATPHLKLEVVDLFRKGRVKILDPLEEKKKRREEEDERVNAEVMEKIYFNDPEKIRSMREDEERKKVDKPFYNVRPKGTKVVRDASLLEDDAVFAENGFYFVCQGIDLRNCPADQQLPMGQYELDLCKKHVGAHLCRRAADLESRPDVADELRNSAKKLDWGTKGRAKYLERKEERRLDVLRAERKDFREARLAAKAAREQLDDAEAAAEAAQDALEAEDMRAIAAAAAKFEALLESKKQPAAIAPKPLDNPFDDDDDDDAPLDDEGGRVASATATSASSTRPAGTSPRRPGR
ncbi:hypothetical protein JL721_11623 [Aureococcus anophagefferens]|nr:hypothetical protein JL721_11623 [Aureococcus anophagefferens]